jgi:hypothetical protein
MLWMRTATDGIMQPIGGLLRDDPLRWQLSKNASKDARERFDIEEQAEQYLQWYAELAGKSCFTGGSFDCSPLTEKEQT